MTERHSGLLEDMPTTTIRRKQSDLSDSADSGKAELSPDENEKDSALVDRPRSVSVSQSEGTESGDHELSASQTELVRVRGEPVITTGQDVSNFAISDRDDGDAALTLRSLVLGTIVAGLSATLAQIYYFKPVDVAVSPVFMLLLIYAAGNLWAAVLPTGRGWGGRMMGIINPGKFGLKEHVVATLIATTASNQSSAVQNFAVQKLYYNTQITATTAILATFSTACFGYGLVGLYRPLTVYPSEMVYWEHLPNVTVLQALHFDVKKNSKRLKLFWSSLSGMAIYEIFPLYIMPLLNGISIPCLATQGASPAYRSKMTNIFGGAEGNEGLGLFALSFDWSYITSAYLSLLLVMQINSWIGLAICYVAVLGIYYSNTWNSQSLPLLSSSIFSNTSTTGNAVRYNQTAVFGPTFTLNETALAIEGLPVFTGSYTWSLMASNWAIGGLLAHVVLFWGGYMKECVRTYAKSFRQRTQFDSSEKTATTSSAEPLDRHYVKMQKYSEAPWWWYLTLLVLSFFAGLVVVVKGGTTLPVWGYIVALLLGSFIAPFSNILFARMGNGIGTSQLMKMVAGAILPGKPVANLYFSMWSHDVVATSILLAGDLKMGQYLKIPPRVMFLTQVWGTIVGVFVNYAVMATIVKQQRDILLDPRGTNVWTGFAVQYTNSLAVTWSLASGEFGLHSQYVWVSVGLGLGAIPTIIQYFIWKRWPVIGGVKVNSIVLPIIYQFSQWLTGGVNSTTLSIIATGLISQVYLRRYKPRWFRKYIYILGGALDGGAQIMVFILSFAVFGASGKARPFPNWWGNPSLVVNNVDYCIQN